MKKILVRAGKLKFLFPAMVLPSLLVVPFIFILRMIKPEDEWLVWVVIFSFLGALVAMVILLASRVYSPAEVIIKEKTIEVKFMSPGNWVMRDVTFPISDLKSVVERPVGDYKFLDVSVRISQLRFQIGPAKNKIEDLLAFEELVALLSEISPK
ncbi:MAG: hypothetical protein FJZ78_09715 [Bacteroidetes bacterium]|nr:hypothetical protein [Bacteroidota bacterium]